MSLSQFKVTADRPLFGYFASLPPVTMPALLPTVIKQISSKIVRPHVNIFCGMGSETHGIRHFSIFKEIPVNCIRLLFFIENGFIDSLSLIREH